MELIASPCSWSWVKVLTSITWCPVCCRDMFHKDLSTATQSTAMLSTAQEMMYFTKTNLKRSYFRFASPPTTESPGHDHFKQLPTPVPKGWNCPSLRSCPLPIIPLSLSREEGMIHFFVGSHVKKPESGLFSDWIGNNTDDLRCSDWPKCRHPLVVVDFSLHFCLRHEQWMHTRVRYKISAGSVFLNLKNA